MRIVHEKNDLFSQEEIDRIKQVSKAALVCVGVCSGMALALLLPNMASMIGETLEWGANFREGQRKSSRLIQYARGRRAIYYLRKRELVEMDRSTGEEVVRLTNKGLEALKLIKKNIVDIPMEHRQWDGKWWVIASDIPTKTHRANAENFRKKLKSLGFYSLQRSLWLFPYSPVEQINMIAQDLGIMSFVTVMRVDRLEVADKVKLMKFFYFLNKN